MPPAPCHRPHPARPPQAFRRLRLGSTLLLRLYMSLTVAVALPLSLALDGADWAAGFAGWAAGDWCMLTLGGTVLYVGQMSLLNYSAWRLGAPLVSMMYGLRVRAAGGQAEGGALPALAGKGSRAAIPQGSQTRAALL